MKPVEIRGYIDFEKTQKVEKSKDKEKGYEFVTTMFTHLDKNERPCGILVNRGWVPKDLN